MVPRWILKHREGGYLLDTPMSDNLQFGVSPHQAREFFSKKAAEKLANLYSLEVVEVPRYVTAKAGSR